MSAPTMEVLAEPFGPCRRTSLFTRAGGGEVAEHAVDCRLPLLLACHAHRARLGREVEVEDAEAPLLAPRHGHLDRAEVVDDVPQVLRRAPRLGARSAAEQVEVVVEGEEAAPFGEAVLHALPDRR